MVVVQVRSTHIFMCAGVDILYQQLFCIFINYIGLLTPVEELFAIFTAYPNASYFPLST